MFRFMNHTKTRKKLTPLFVVLSGMALLYSCEKCGHCTATYNGETYNYSSVCGIEEYEKAKSLCDENQQKNIATNQTYTWVKE
jgi:hypothetical protein